MANTLEFYTPEFNRISTHILGTGNQIEGVYYDGLYFWTVDSGTFLCEQFYITQAGSAELVSSFDLSGIIPLDAGESVTSIDAITGDGLDLYIAYNIETTDGEFPPIVTETTVISKFDKKGNLLKDIYSYDSISFGFLHDMTWNGLNLFLTTDSASKYLFQIDVATGKKIATITTQQILSAIAWNGVNFYCFRDSALGQGNVMDYTGKFLAVAVPSGFASPPAMDFGTGHLNIDGAHDMFEGQWIVLAHR